MAQKKAHEVDAWLARPDPRIRLVLVYGPDRGLVTERAARFAASTGLALDDPFSVIRYEAAELEQDPGRILDEAAAIPMFGGSRLLWIRNAGAHKGLAEALGLLATSPPPDATVLVEAGDLKKSAPLRTVAEGAAGAMALPCFADEGRSIDALIDAELGRVGLRIGLEARAALRRRLGGDRLASRAELEKLMLYCGEGGEVGVADVEASTGDVASTTVDQAVDAILAGTPVELDRAVQRLVEADVHAQQSLGAAMRQFHALALMRRAVDLAGVSAASAVAAARPPVFYARKALLEGALPSWTAARIAGALRRLQEAVLMTRRRPDLADAIVRQSFLVLTLESQRYRKTR